MKELILVRHGKSSWEYSVNDKDRPLLQRGINDGHLVVGAFKKKKIRPDAVFSSPANRALHTCMIFLRSMDFTYADFQITNALYDFSGDDVLQFVKELDNGLETVMIFGHNHAFTHIANSLGSEYIDNVPTSGLVHLNFNTNDWSAIGKGSTSYTIFPKSLK
tara:strand:- start:4782 stop:5267 length:486 start_codon:yes stop_codon:yes gene_type:complete